jgi:hypothetical protein
MWDIPTGTYVGLKYPVGLSPAAYKVAADPWLRIRGDMRNDNLGTSFTEVYDDDVGYSIKFQNTSITSENWVLPLSWGVGSNLENFNATLNSTLNDHEKDLVVGNLSFSQDEYGEVTTTAQVINLGLTGENVTVNLLVNQSIEVTREIFVGPGEEVLVDFPGANYTRGKDNLLSVQVLNLTGDDPRNNARNLTVFCRPRKYDLNVTVIGANFIPLEDIGVSLRYENGTEVYNEVTTTSGNIIFMLLSSGNYSLEFEETWNKNQFLGEMNFSIPENSTIVKELNISSVVARVVDVDAYPVQSCTVAFEDNETEVIIEAGVTNNQGDFRFRWFPGIYNLRASILLYGTMFNLTGVDGFNLTSTMWEVIQEIPVNLTSITLNITDTSFTPISNAKVEFYNQTSIEEHYIATEISDVNGSVIFVYLASQNDQVFNYSFRVLLQNQYRRLIQVPPWDDLPTSFVHTCYNVVNRLYIILKVQTGFQTEYETAIILYSSAYVIKTWGESLELKFGLNVTKNGPGEGGMYYASYTNILINNWLGELVYSGEASQVVGEVGNHSVSIDSTQVPKLIGGNELLYSIIISASLDGYVQSPPKIVFLTMNHIKTKYSGIQQDQDVSFIWGSSKVLLLQFLTENGNEIVGVNASIQWSAIHGDDYFEEMQEDGGGNYSYFINNYVDWVNVGSYQVKIRIEKQNYESKVIEFGIVVEEIPTFLESFHEQETSKTKSLVVVLNYSTITSIVENASISYILKRGDQNFTEYVTLVISGVHTFTFSPDLPRGNYDFEVILTKPNYQTQTFSIKVNVDWPIIWGLPEVVWYIIIAMLATVIGGIGLYRYVRWARIPEITKLIMKTRKTITKDRDIGELKIADSFSEQLKRIHGRSWDAAGVPAPFAEYSSTVIYFTRVYNSATRGQLLVGEASDYLTNIAIFSEDQMKEQLKQEGAMNEYVPDLIQTIRHYIREIEEKKS